MKKLLPLLLLALCLCFPALAEEATDITGKCEISSSYYRNTFRVNDGKTKTRFDKDIKKKQDNWIEFKTPKKTPAYGLYMIWPEEAPVVALEIYNSKTKAWEHFADVNRGEYVHEYIELPGVQRFRLHSTDEKGSMPLLEMNVLSEGELPDWVQVWEPSHTQCDLLLLSAHADDEYIFFGGAIPYYIAEGYNVQVAFAAIQSEVRLHELLNALWVAGGKNYPVFLGFYDKLCEKARTAYKYWGGEDAALDAFAALIEQTRPSVVITHDINGEYGHGAHMACADMALQVIRDGKRDLQWKPQKLYLHLWKENPITVEWEQPHENLGGRTPLEVAQLAFKEHKSQQGFSAETRSGREFKFKVHSHGMFDNADFGLAYTTVGPDVACNDFMENVN